MESYFESWWWMNLIRPSDALFVIGLICSLCLGLMAKRTSYIIWDNILWQRHGPAEDGPLPGGHFPKEQWWQWLIGAALALLCWLFFWPFAALAITIVVAACFVED